jgi:hypothetical protein
MFILLWDNVGLEATSGGPIESLTSISDNAFAQCPLTPSSYRDSTVSDAWQRVTESKLSSG